MLPWFPSRPARDKHEHCPQSILGAFSLAACTPWFTSAALLFSRNLRAALPNSMKCALYAVLLICLLPAGACCAQAPPAPSKPVLKGSAAGSYRIGPNGSVRVRGGISLSYEGYTLTADNLDGSLGGALIFSGNAHIEGMGVSAYADIIRFHPASMRYRLENARGTLAPSLFENRILQPLHLLGGSIAGDSSGYFSGRNLIATTCSQKSPHYELHIGSATMIPGDRLAMHRVSIVLFGVKLITLPTLIIPLHHQFIRRPSSNYLPEFGQNPQDGYFAHFPYSYAIGAAAAGLIRLDITQLHGPGFRIEQEYLAGRQGRAGGYSSGSSISQSSGDYLTARGYGITPRGLPPIGSGIGPANGGLFAAQGYFGSGTGSNFTLTLKHQQSLGSSNRISFDEELQHNSYFVGAGASSGSYTQTTRLDLTHNDTAHGSTGTLSLSLNNNSSSSYSASQLNGSLNQTLTFDSRGSVSNTITYSLNLAHLLTTSTSGGASSVQRTERLTSQFQLQHIATDYQYTLSANGSTPIGPQSGGNFGGGLEKLPELLVNTDTLSYKGGWLRHIPTDFQFGFGRYSEPGSNVNTDRFLLAFNLLPFRVMRGSTEIVTGGGLEQHLYGDGAAEYQIHDETHLRQHLLGRSGFDINYFYNQPEGASPFLFDQLQRSNYLTANAGYLDDRHFQLTAGVGYDFNSQSQTSPWQVLTTRMMWRPFKNLRLDATQTFDPNTGRFYSLTNSLRYRGPNNMSLDLLANIDPNEPGIHRKITQLNLQLDLPLGRSWRLLSLLLYNGLTNSVESQNYQLTHDWDCLRATLTYTRTTGGFLPENSIFFTISLKAFPYARAFARGPQGQTLGSGIGGFY